VLGTLETKELNLLPGGKLSGHADSLVKSDIDDEMLACSGALREMGGYKNVCAAFERLTTRRELILH
jgi:hypothetical protein